MNRRVRYIVGTLIFCGVLGVSAATWADHGTKPCLLISPTAVGIERVVKSVEYHSCVLAREALRATVTITSRGETLQGGVGTGSGFVIDPSGLVVTNNHVVENAKDGGSVAISFSDGRTSSATIVGTDTETDLALLSIDDVSEAPFPTLLWGDSDALRVGYYVFALGSPFGLFDTATFGRISNLHREMPDTAFFDFIQTDAPINIGNSGGPLIDSNGTVVGVNSRIYSEKENGGNSGIGFAIPSNTARRVVAELEKHGRVRRGWLGVEIMSVTDVIVSTYGLADAHGVFVVGVSSGSPADRAGIRAGDMIRAWGPLAVFEIRDLVRLVAETPVGSDVAVGVWRDGAIQMFSITVAERIPQKQRSGDEQGWMVPDVVPGEPWGFGGMLVEEIMPTLREQFNLPETATGLVVTEVAGGTITANAGVQAGDVIVLIGGTDVSTHKEARSVIVGMVKNGVRTLLLTVRRGGKLTLLPIDLYPDAE